MEEGADEALAELHGYANVVREIAALERERKNRDTDQAVKRSLKNVDDAVETALRNKAVKLSLKERDLQSLAERIGRDWQALSDAVEASVMPVFRHSTTKGIRQRGEEADEDAGRDGLEHGAVPPGTRGRHRRRLSNGGGRALGDQLDIIAKKLEEAAGRIAELGAASAEVIRAFDGETDAMPRSLHAVNAFHRRLRYTMQKWSIPPSIPDASGAPALPTGLTMAFSSLWGRGRGGFADHLVYSVVQSISAPEPTWSDFPWLALRKTSERLVYPSPGLRIHCSKPLVPKATIDGRAWNVDATAFELSVVPTGLDLSEAPRMLFMHGFLHVKQPPENIGSLPRADPRHARREDHVPGTYFMRVFDPSDPDSGDAKSDPPRPAVMRWRVLCASRMKLAAAPSPIKDQGILVSDPLPESDLDYYTGELAPTLFKAGTASKLDYYKGNLAGVPFEAVTPKAAEERTARKALAAAEGEEEEEEAAAAAHGRNAEGKRADAAKWEYIMQPVVERVGARERRKNHIILNGEEEWQQREGRLTTNELRDIRPGAMIHISLEFGVLHRDVHAAAPESLTRLSSSAVDRIDVHRMYLTYVIGEESGPTQGKRYHVWAPAAWRDMEHVKTLENDHRVIAEREDLLQTTASWMAGAFNSPTPASVPVPGPAPVPLPSSSSSSSSDTGSGKPKAARNSVAPQSGTSTTTGTGASKPRNSTGSIPAGTNPTRGERGNQASNRRLTKDTAAAAPPPAVDAPHSKPNEGPRNPKEPVKVLTGAAPQSEPAQPPHAGSRLSASKGTGDLRRPRALPDEGLAMSDDDSVWDAWW
jgi:hypothetical protein